MKNTNKLIIVPILCCVACIAAIFGLYSQNKKLKAQISAPEARETITQLNQDIAIKQKAIDEVMKQLLLLETSDKISAHKLDEYATLVREMQQHVAGLNSLIAILQNENAIQEDQIQELKVLRAQLLQTISTYQQLIDSMPIIEDRFVVTFVFDNLVYAIAVLPDETLLDITAPESTEFVIFLGWSLTQDGELVDISTLQVTGDTVLFAVLQRLPRIYTVTFADRGEIVSTQHINYAEYAKSVGRPPRDGYEFMGWSYKGSIVNLSQYQIIEHIEFTAVWREWSWQVAWSGDTQYNFTATGQQITIPFLTNATLGVAPERVRIRYRTINTNGMPVTETITLARNGYLLGGYATDNYDKPIDLRILSYTFGVGGGYMTAYLMPGSPFSTVTLNLLSISVLQ